MSAQSNNFKYFGCFDFSPKNFSINISEDSGKEYTIKECSELAINNDSSVFGLISSNFNEKGKCFLSDSNIKPLQQSYNAVKDGLSLDNCRNGIGNTQENSIALFY